MLCKKCVQTKKKLLNYNCLDVGRVGEKHGEPVDTHPPTSSRRQAILQGCAKIVVHHLSFVITSSLVLVEQKRKQIKLLTKRSEKQFNSEQLHNTQISRAKNQSYLQNMSIYHISQHQEGIAPWPLYKML